MDTPRGHYTKWNKSEKDKYHMFSRICGIQIQTNKHNQAHSDREKIAGWQGQGLKAGDETVKKVKR